MIQNNVRKGKIINVTQQFTQTSPRPSQAVCGRTVEDTWEVALPVPTQRIIFKWLVYFEVLVRNINTSFL